MNTLAPSPLPITTSPASTSGSATSTADPASGPAFADALQAAQARSDARSRSDARADAAQARRDDLARGGERPESSAQADGHRSGSSTPSSPEASSTEAPASDAPVAGTPASDATPSDATTSDATAADAPAADAATVGTAPDAVVPAGTIEPEVASVPLTANPDAVAVVEADGAVVDQPAEVEEGADVVAPETAPVVDAQVPPAPGDTAVSTTPVPQTTSTTTEDAPTAEAETEAIPAAGPASDATAEQLLAQRAAFGVRTAGASGAVTAQAGGQPVVQDGAQASTPLVTADAAVPGAPIAAEAAPAIGEVITGQTTGGTPAQADPTVATPAAAPLTPTAVTAKAAAAATLTGAPTNVPTPPPGAQVAGAVASLRRQGDGNYTASIDLHPAELGRVQIDVEITAGVVNVRLSPEQSGTRALMQSQLADLRAALEQSGLDAGSLDVSSQSRGDQREQGSSPRRGGSAGPAEPIIANRPLAITREHQTDTSVDLRV